MQPTTYRSRRAWTTENDFLRLTVLAEGGHIAELTHRPSGLNPLWTPPWPTIEPSTYSPAKHPEYGSDSESQLLAGIHGHNLCLDLFGPPSPAEAAAGYTVHGEASILPYSLAPDGWFHLRLPKSHLHFRRFLRLDGLKLHVTGELENLLPFDRAVAWQEHATLGPPFVERGVTRIEAPAVRSARLDGTEFTWTDRSYPAAARTSNFHTNLLSAGYAEIRNERRQLALRYTWDAKDFPWLGIWEENEGRTPPPWLNRTITWGIEFGASPFPETRSQRAARGHLWGHPTAIWLPALGKRTISYAAELLPL